MFLQRFGIENPDEGSVSTFDDPEMANLKIGDASTFDDDDDDVVNDRTRALVDEMEDLMRCGNAAGLHAMIGELGAVRGSILVNSRMNAFCGDYAYCTPLGFAICLNDPLLVSTLLHLGADARMPPCLLTNWSSITQDARTALHLSAMRFVDARIVKYLMTDDETICAISPALFFPVLYYAVKSVDASVAARLMAVGRIREFINAVDREERTALHAAAKEGTVQVVQLLVNAGIDVNRKDQFQKTALMYAARRSMGVEIVKLLLANGADVAAVDRSGRNALRYAVQTKNVNTCEALVQAGADALKGDLKDISPLESVVVTGGSSKRCSATCSNIGDDSSKAVALLTVLVKHTKLPVRLRDQSFLEACRLVMKAGEGDMTTTSPPKIIERLFTDNAKHVRTRFAGTGQSLIHVAAKYNSCAPTLRWMLSGGYGFEVDAADDDGFSPLHHACRAGAGECVDVLLELGAGVDALIKSDVQWTPLWLAIRYGHGELAMKFIRAGCDVRTEIQLKYLRQEDSPVILTQSLDDPAERSSVEYARRGLKRITPLEYALHMNDVQTAFAISQAYCRSMEDSRAARQNLLTFLDGALLSKDAKTNKFLTVATNKMKDWLMTAAVD